jgi:DNA-binding transcriptional LysR family regulator
MDLALLRTFVVVAEELHFGRAASRLNLAQPAVSQQVKRLERQLGTPLLHRTTRSVELTDAGRHLEARARSILTDVERTEVEVQQIRRGRVGRVSIGFVGTATYDVLPQVSRRIRSELPDLELEVLGERLSPALIEALQDHRLDLALVRNPEPAPDLRAVHLRTEPLIAVLPVEQAGPGSTVRLADLSEFPFVTHPSGYRSAMFTAVLQACRQAGFLPKEVIEVGETSTLVAFVAAGLGVALVPESVRSLGLDGVAYRALADVTMPTELMLLTRAGEQSPAARSVAGIVTRTVGAARRTASG